MIGERFAEAARLADAVLYEGYMLYPYRKSALKNQMRWQFGVVAPSATHDAQDGFAQTECLIESGAAALLTVTVRFLHLQQREVQARREESWEACERVVIDGKEHLSWEEAVLCEITEAKLPLAELLAGRALPHAISGSRAIEEIANGSGTIVARVVREREPLSFILRVSARAIGPLMAVTVRVENTRSFPEREGAEQARPAGLAISLLNCHALLGVENGAFISALDAAAVDAGTQANCRNWWPVLVGPRPARDVMLCAPVILSEYPEIAPESDGDFFDSTEIDELLTLRVMTLTAAEKRELAATDDRARRILDRVEQMAPARHQSGDEPFRKSAVGRTEIAPIPSFEAFVNPPGLAAPEDAKFQLGPTSVGRGTRVRLAPRGRADAMDMFLEGRIATVAAVYQDLDDRTHVAVTLDDDPSADLRRALGRYFYFAPEDLEPLLEERRA